MEMKVGQTVKIYGFLIWWERSFRNHGFFSRTKDLPCEVKIIKITEDHIFFKDFNGQEDCICYSIFSESFNEDILYFASGPLLEVKK